MSNSLSQTLYRYRAYLAAALVALVATCINISFAGFPFKLVDSPLVLIQALSFSPTAILTNPDASQILSPHNFTPWIALSWQLDYALGGLNPAVFRYHHLLSIVFMNLLIFALLLRICRSVALAALFAVAVTLLPTNINLGSDLVVRHYVEGFIFALLSVLSVLAFNDSGRKRYIYVSVFFYALASISKEVYVPLPVVLFAILRGPLLTRLSRTLPFLCVTALYMILRSRMVSSSGDVSVAGALESLPFIIGNIVVLLKKIGHGLFDSQFIYLIILGAATIALIANRKKVGFTTFAIVAAVAVALSVTLLPVSAYIIDLTAHSRWLFLPGVALLLLLAFLCSISSTRLKLLFGIVVSALLIVKPALQLTSQELKKPMGHKAVTHIMNNKTHKIRDIDILPLGDTDPDSRGFIELVAQSHIHWRTVYFLHNNEWGTEFPPLKQLRQYHAGGAMRGDDSFAGGVSFNASTREFVFSIPGAIHGGVCGLYVFGKHNGSVMSLDSCEAPSVSLSTLRVQSARAGYRLNEANIALWNISNGEIARSAAYPIEPHLKAGETN